MRKSRSRNRRPVRRCADSVRGGLARFWHPWLTDSIAPAACAGVRSGQRVLPGEWPEITPRTADYFAELTNMLVDRQCGLRDEHGVMIGNR
jgi:hypothetical protein